VGPFDSLIGGALAAAEDPAAPRLARYRPVGALPDEAWAALSAPQYQRRASSCLPHAVAFALEAEALERTGALVQVSIMDAYYGYRRLAGDWPNDVGSYPHKAQEWHRDHGTVSAVVAPYDDTMVTTWRPKPEWADDRPLLTAELERMPADVEQIKAEIAARRCVIVCHHVYAQMANTGLGNAGSTGLELDQGVDPSLSLGGHARCIVAYKNQRFGFINWWKGWGVAHPKDLRFPDSFSWVPEALVVSSRWQFDFRRIARGLAVEV
jgi:hypothetical protein